MGVSATAFACWHIIYPVGSLDAKRHILQLLCYGEITSWIMNFLQIDDLS